MSGPQRRRPRVLLIVGVTLVLGLVAAAIRPEWHIHPLDFTMPDSGTKPSPQMNTQAQQTLPQHNDSDNLRGLAVVGWVLLGLLIALGLGIGWMVLRRLIGLTRARRRAQRVDAGVTGETAESDRSTMHQGARAAQRRMAESSTPTDAIIAAWLELERAAAESGVSRTPAQTPTEFTTDVLARTAADARATQTLLKLYLRARFSTMTITAEDMRQARECVYDIAASWDHLTTSSPHDGAAGKATNSPGANP